MLGQQVRAFGSVSAAALLVVCALAGCRHAPAAVGTPSALHDAGVVFDPATGGALAFGGTRHDPRGGRGYTPSATTWAFDGTGWRMLRPPTSPPARQHPLLVADPDHRRVLLFGGTSDSYQTVSTGRSPGRPETVESTSDRMVDGWAWDGRTWQRLPGYAAQVSGQAVYDPTLGTVVLVGTVRVTTSTLPVASTDNPPATWAWTGHGWRVLSPAVPRQETLVSLAYDPVSHRLVGLAAQRPSPPRHCTRLCPGRPTLRGFAHLWVFDGRTWQRDPTDTGLDQTGATLTTDPTTGTLMLVSDSGRTWGHLAGGWTRLDPPRTPPAQHLDAVQRATHTARQALLLTSGTTDHTWTFDGHTWHDRGTGP